MAQSFKNHARWVPAYHFFALPMLLIYFVWSLVHAVRHVSTFAVMQCLMAAALVVAVFNARVFALAVQDRLIRLEMRLRLQQVLPAEMRVRILEFTPSQLIGLRFASDAELPQLARKVLDEKIENRTAIKKLIQNWQAD